MNKEEEFYIKLAEAEEAYEAWAQEEYRKTLMYAGTGDVYPNPRYIRSADKRSEELKKKHKIKDLWHIERP